MTKIEDMGIETIQEALAEITPRLLTTYEVARFIMIPKMTGNWDPEGPVAQLIGHIIAVQQQKEEEEEEEEDAGDRR